MGLAVLFAAALAATQEPPGCDAETICRRVTDPRSQPLPLVEIRVDAGDASWVIITDEAGRAATPRGDVPAGSRVVITAPGYAPLALTGAQFAAATGDLVLSPVDETADIIVTARRVSTPFATKVIDQLALVTDPSANADALLAVAGLPSATNVDNSADIQLRGGAIGLSRIYFNDIPLYEVVRGSAVDQVTRVSSIFNPSIVQNIEVYSTNPPTYLANSAAGAVRILPNATATNASSLFAGLQGLTYSTSRSLADGGAAQIYASATDLGALLAVNPGLRRTTSSFRSVGGGTSVTLPLPDAGNLTAFAVVDAEHGTYPLQLLNLAGPSTSGRRRVYATVSGEVPAAGGRLKVDLAYTGIRNRFAYRGFDAVAHNDYLYAAVEQGGRLGPLDYRAGVSVERIGLRTVGSLLFYDAGGGAPPQGELRRQARYGSAYAFFTYMPAANATFALGTRQFLSDRPRQSPVYSAAFTWNAPDRRHRIVVSGGTYSALIPPEIGTLAQVRAARSRQLSVDYAFKSDIFDLEAGAYAKADRIDGVTTDIQGADGTLTVRAHRRLGLGLTLATSRQRIGPDRAPNDLAYLVRATARLALSNTAALNARYTAKSGAVYSRLDDVGFTPAGDAFPIFGPGLNAQRLPGFAVLDLTLLDRLQQWPGARKPIVFLSISNALDRRNPARVVYAPDFGSDAFSYYEPRTVSVGLVLRV